MRDKKTLAEGQAAIGDLQIGDYVLVYLTLDGETIETTPDHPFSIAKRAWRPVGELQPDDRIHNAGGTTDWSRR